MATKPGYISKDLLMKLTHPDYFKAVCHQWGTTTDWDIYFKQKHTKYTRHKSHATLSSELDIILKTLEGISKSSKVYQKAKSMRDNLKVMFGSGTTVTRTWRGATPRDVIEQLVAEAGFGRNWQRLPKHKAIIALSDPLNLRSDIIEGSDDWDAILRGIVPECSGIDESGTRTPPRQMISKVDIAECIDSLSEKSLLHKFPTLQPPYWGIVDLSGQHSATKARLADNFHILEMNFQKKLNWRTGNLTADEAIFFDNMKDTKINESISLVRAHLTIMQSFLGRPRLPLTEGEYVIRIVGPVFNASLDPKDEHFHKRWLEQQLLASQERRIEILDPDDRTRIGQKTDLIIDLGVGVLEGFLCEVSGGIPAGSRQKVWSDKVKMMVGMRDVFNAIVKAYPGLPESAYQEIVIYGCQVVVRLLHIYDVYYAEY
ncbi:hypothetical protein BC936DRAFT_136858 [Jimgerdemannia flammicorona]|uniref:Uncharacterized protein n=1 Tax=Jimgerdemannia flammicorona TaxID=994334 RepID=A0A433CYL5_9FUNG|nr:hypothetical protein BC936DRAFT_136858 [Jimgerdemannia flammicorona]